MDEDNLNIEIRKFLKKVGISSQRIIETSLTSKFPTRLPPPPPKKWWQKLNPFSK